jgi:hypothetical protein
MPAPSLGSPSRNGRMPCPDRAVAFLRSRYPSKTADCVAADTGIGAETVKKWLDGAARPSWDGALTLVFTYGPAFLAAVFPRQPRWLTDAYQREQLAALEEEQARIQSKIQALKAQP